MPGEVAQEAAKLLFINAGERKEQVEWVEYYQVQTMCWLPMQQRIQTSTAAGYIASEEMNYKSILDHLKSEKLIPNQPALERVWGAELKAQGEGNKQRLAWGQLWHP